MLSSVTSFKVPLPSHLIRHDTVMISPFATFVVIVTTYQWEFDKIHGNVILSYLKTVFLPEN